MALWSSDYPPVFDEKDQEILDARVALLNKVEGPRVGDWIRFADGVERRIAYIWDFDDEPKKCQIEDRNGSYYLGGGGCSMSGSLDPGVTDDKLTLTEETKPGWVWFFHHDFARAHNGVHAQVDFRVYTCTLTHKEAQ